MKLELKRTIFTDKSTIGKLYVDGVFECYTLEDKVRPYPQKVKGETAIWEGTYRVTIDYSPKYKKDMPHVLSVPFFSGIRIHSGNRSADTEGCILLGMSFAEDSIFQSRLAFQKFLPKLQDALTRAEDVFITITNTPDPSTTQ